MNVAEGRWCPVSLDLTSRKSVLCMLNFRSHDIVFTIGALGFMRAFAFTGILSPRSGRSPPSLAFQHHDFLVHLAQACQWFCECRPLEFSMHGQIHIVLKDLIISVFSIETWAAILRRSSLQEDHLLEAVQQPDEVTFKLLAATCEETELSLEDALEAFGRHLVTFTMQSGYAGLLKSLGPTFPVFLTNVNYLHNHLERQHPHALFPYIETNYEHGQDSLEMHYLSTRPRLKQLLVGIVIEVGLQLFGLDVSMTEQSSPRYSQRNVAGSERAASWEISWRPTSQNCAPPRPTTPKASFPDIHAAMVDFGKLLSSFDVLSTFACCVAEDDHEFTPLDCSTQPAELTEAERKFEAVQAVRGADGAATSRLEEVLLRATPAHLLAAGWTDDSMKSCIDFWSSSVGTALNYAMSQDADAVDIFVSHTWLPPADWEEMMGPDVNYAEMKAATLAVMAKDFAQEHGSFQDWHQITFWVDKACIAQEHPELKKLSINLLDNFIQRCDSMCVLFCWTYLQRLWCVYEWACVLIHKPTEKVYLQTELFVREETLPLYLQAVRNFSLAKTKCGVEADREVLEAQIRQAYISKQQFEVLVKATVIALMARSMAFRAGRSPKLYFTYFQPWVALAFELGMDELGSALDSCDCLTWRRVATISSENSGGKKVQPQDRPASAAEVRELMSPFSSRGHALSPEHQENLMQMGIGVNSLLFHQVISDWFETDVVPVLAKIKEASTK